MDELFAHFSSLLTPETFSNATAEAQRSFDRDMSTQSKSLVVRPPDPDPRAGGSTIDLTNLDLTNPAHRADVLKSWTDGATKVRFPPPENLPCANHGVQAGQYEACNKRGSMACGSCKLVSYCSKVSSVRSHST